MLLPTSRGKQEVTGETEAKALEKRGRTYYIMPMLEKTRVWLCDAREGEARP